MTRTGITRRSLLAAVGATVACASGTGSTMPPRSGPALDPALLEVITEASTDELHEALHRVRADGVDTLLLAVHDLAVRDLVPARLFRRPHHALLVVPAVREVVRRVPASDGWVAVVWAIEYLRRARATDRGFVLVPLQSRELPRAADAEAELGDALHGYDAHRADRAITALVRAGARDRAVQRLLHHGSQDFREIGHKLIHVVQGLRGVVGRDDVATEAAMRAMVFTLTLHDHPVGHLSDDTWGPNLARGRTLDVDVDAGKDVTATMLENLRGAGVDDAAVEAIVWLGRGATTQSIWDAVSLFAAELMFNNPDSVEAMHAVTATDAARAAFARLESRETRATALLQAVARVADFRDYAGHWARLRGDAPASAIAVETLAPRSGSVELAGLVAGFSAADVGVRIEIAERTLAYASGETQAQALVHAAIEQLPIRVVDDAHDYKLTIAVRDESRRIAPRWRAHYLALCTSRLCSSGRPTSELAHRVARV